MGTDLVQEAEAVRRICQESGVSGAVDIHGKAATGKVMTVRSTLITKNRNTFAFDPMSPAGRSAWSSRRSRAWPSASADTNHRLQRLWSDHVQWRHPPRWRHQGGRDPDHALCVNVVDHVALMDLLQMTAEGGSASAPVDLGEGKNFVSQSAK
jgi:hypothetical protein